MLISRPAVALLGIVLFACAMAESAAATTLAELQAQGYRVLRDTRLPGPFTGCNTHTDWILEDGSVFVCHGTWRVNLMQPRALLLRGPSAEPKLPTGPTYIMLIAGHAYDATLLKLGHRELGTPLTLTPVLDAPPALQSGERGDDQIKGILPTQSIDDLRLMDHVKLNDAQRFPIDAPPGAAPLGAPPAGAGPDAALPLAALPVGAGPVEPAKTP